MKLKEHVMPGKMVRTVTKYLAMPVIIGNEMRWLETATYQERYTNFGWRKIRWIDVDGNDQESEYGFTYWLVGQFRMQTAEGPVWDCQGIFDSHEKAVAACRTQNYFIMPLELNKQLPHETIVITTEYPKS